MPSIDPDVVTALSRAVDDDAVVVHLQPEIVLATGAVVGMEALMRWRHPHRGLIPAAEFVSIAEEAGLLPGLGWQVLRRAACEVVSWKSLPQIDGQPRQLWVNVSASQLLEDRFADRVAQLLSEFGVPAGVLGLEFTEHTLELGGPSVAAVLAELHGAGVALAIDDFGSWHSALGNLGELPIAAVKLDHTFVRTVGLDLENDSIVSSVIALAHSYGVRVVAEGVESWSEGAQLFALGCDRAIGLLFGEPQPAEQAHLMLAHGAGWAAPQQRLPVEDCRPIVAARKP
jgi:EAL domain-containing protein (putative c-di-GMP-specific phosphodiesterase class I)